MKIKIAVAAVAAAALLLFFGVRFFNAVHEKEWQIQRNAVQTAYQKTILTKADKVDRFVGDKPFTIIQGENKIGQKMIVWVAEDVIYSQMASDGVNAEQVKAAVLAHQADADIVRMMPGVLNGTLVWEVFYKVKDDAAGERYYYDYYSFKDGAMLDTYRLSIQ
ncbi:DUF5590 domain-containing protein [Paenibacillus rigui]|uniref:Cell wall elongation regulator TseB-like domain-containing protein n=1 Tax=Paenibacillus rigui TaxID=554312 RepID=A0A229UX25_9BACL|nr:DUF5590 domain-containing protein [Paenibacillus rigui]OXM88027.1 hypothetical protein CF651_02730 [Paenibacillus rigui]